MVNKNNRPQDASASPSFKYLSIGFDNSGRVFVLDDIIYRGLSHYGKSVFEYLSDKGILERLFSAGLVPSEISDISLGGYEMVIKHKRIPFISYCQEWPFEMLKQAALLQCRLVREVAAIGLATKDAHPWNIAFDFTRPVFMDFSSIAFLKDVSLEHWTSEFKTHFYIPLWLAAHKQYALARWCIKEHFGPIKHIISHKKIEGVLMAFNRIVAKARNKNFSYFLDLLIEHLESLKVSSRKGEWSEYTQAEWKGESIKRVVNDLKFKTVIDMGANKGVYSSLMSDLGLSVVSFDNDEYAVESLYANAHQNHRSILPLVIDFLYPTPPFGMNLYGESSFDRLRCDMGVVLGLVHHLVFRNNINFEIIASIINRYVRSYALVEFIPKNDKYVSEWVKGKESDYEWYCENNFVSDFMKFFKSFEVWNSPVDTRKLYLFRR